MLKLTFACHDYDHVRDIFEPEVITEGIELTQLKLPVEEIFFRFIKFGEFEISEHSFRQICQPQIQKSGPWCGHPGISVEGFSSFSHLCPNRFRRKTSERS